MSSAGLSGLAGGPAGGRGPDAAGHRDAGDAAGGDGDHRGRGGQRLPAGAAAAGQQRRIGLGRGGLGGAPAGAVRGEPVVEPPVGAGGGVGHGETSRSGRRRARASARVDFTVPSAQPITAAVSATVRPA